MLRDAYVSAVFFDASGGAHSSVNSAVVWEIVLTMAQLQLVDVLPSLE